MPTRTVQQGAVPPASLAPFTASESPVAVPQVAFNDARGNRISLAQFKGRYVLLNLWATWCAPCVRELPALARLHSAVANRRFQVVAVDIGRGGAADARSFLAAHDAGALDTYVDSNLALLRAFGAYGLPLTVLIDPKATLFILGTEMDYVEEKLQSGFVFRNPNEKGRCGCGESFHV